MSEEIADCRFSIADCQLSFFAQSSIANRKSAIMLVTHHSSLIPALGRL